MKKNNIIIASLLMLPIMPMTMQAFPLAPQIVQEKQDTRQLKGVVYDDCKQPLADVVVTSGGKTTRTNEKGEFELTGVKENADLSVWADGFYSYASPLLRTQTALLCKNTAILSTIFLDSFRTSWYS